MALNQWFKFYGGEYLSDPKIASLTTQERSCWVTILCLSSISSEPGIIEYLTVDALLQKSGIVWDPYNPEEWDKATTVLDKFVRMKMITKSDDGVIEVLNWKKRQDTLMTAAERQAKYRENKKSNANVTGRVTKVTLDKIREDKNTSALEDSQRVVEEVSYSEEERVKKPPKYPNARTVFSWFPAPEPSWKMNTTEQSHAELLFVRGEDAVRGILDFLRKHEDLEFIPQVSKPSDLERKWNDIIKFAEKNGL